MSNEQIDVARSFLEKIDSIEHQIQNALETGVLPNLKKRSRESEIPATSSSASNKKTIKRTSMVEQLALDHSIKSAIDEAQVLAGKAAALLANKKESKSSATQSILTSSDGLTVVESCESLSKSNDIFRLFYNKKAQLVKDFQEHPKSIIERNQKAEDYVVDLFRIKGQDPKELRDGKVDPEWLESAVGFSGEENFGRFLDLHLFHAKFLNFELSPSGNKKLRSKDTGAISYWSYLKNLTDPTVVSISSKLTKEYRDYLEELKEYLISFRSKIQPLVKFDITKALDNFDYKWSKELLPGWERFKEDNLNKIQPPKQDSSAIDSNTGGNNSNASTSLTLIDLSQYKSANELESLGMDRLKIELTNRGLKSGGTLKERADRLFIVKGLDKSKYPKSILANQKSTNQEKDDKNPKESEKDIMQQLQQRKKRLEENAITSAKLECEIQYIIESELGHILRATCDITIKKLTSTQEELAAEYKIPLVGDVQVEDLEVDDEEEPEIYNPLNIPLDFDGKPIPYWLFRLHGLSVKYRCDICGGHVYDGRYEFDRHFQEWRHAAGMQRLGIPNTRHFHDITTIKEARELYAKIQDELKKSQFRPDADAEFEDEQGNVLSKKLYDDFVKQGLINPKST